MRQQDNTNPILPEQVVDDSLLVCLYPYDKWADNEPRLRGKIIWFPYSKFEGMKLSVGYGYYVVIQAKKDLSKLLAAQKTCCVYMSAETDVILKNSCSLIEYYGKINAAHSSSNW